MNRLTNIEVTEQKQRFESFIANVNLAKIGRVYIAMLTNSKGMYNEYNYIQKLLSITAKVSGSCYHPEKMEFYSTILKISGLNAYFNSLKS